MPLDDVIIPDEIETAPLSDEKIARDRAAAPARQLPQPHTIDDDHVAIPPDTGFNVMADKLEKAMAEVTTQRSQPQKPDASSQQSEKTQDKLAVEPKPAETPEDKVFTSAKAADWKALKQKIKDAETQANEWKQKHDLTNKEYEEFKKKAADLAKLEQTNKELETVKAEKEKLETQLETVALERSERFSNAYNKAFADAIGRAREAGGDSADKIEQLLHLPPSKWRKERINEIREELAGVDQGQLDIAIAEYDKARAEKEEALKNSKVNYQRLMDVQAEEQNRLKKLEGERIQAAFNSVMDVAKNYPAFQEANGDDAHNQTVARNREIVSRFLNGQLPTNETAMMPVVAAEGRRLIETVIPALNKKIAELEQAVKDYQGANPKPSGGQQAQHTGQPSDFITRFNELWPQGNQ